MDPAPDVGRACIKRQVDPPSGRSFIWLASDGASFQPRVKQRSHPGSSTTSCRRQGATAHDGGRSPPPVNCQQSSLVRADGWMDATADVAPGFGRRGRCYGELDHLWEMQNVPDHMLDLGAGRSSNRLGNVSISSMTRLERANQKGSACEHLQAA
ncbi:hypothetical protein RJ55_05153 [Drechmeria coniospora]|nr:hypothetical protein RJ55_05153 [Drechmeria coniospora]